MAKSEKDSIKKTQEVTQQTSQQNDVQKDARVEFEQRFNFFMTQFRTVCEEAKTPVAIAIVLDAEHPETPFIYSHGHIYDQALILAEVLRKLKDEIKTNLST
jgi:hypothetical protein